MIWNQLLATIIQAPESAGAVPSAATRLGGGLLTLLIGMVVCFFGLICIIFIVKIQAWIRRGTSKDKGDEASVAESVIEAAQLPEESQEDPNLIALIGAALAAYDQNPDARLVVRSVRRVGGAQTPWQKAAREEAMAR